MLNICFISYFISVLWNNFYKYFCDKRVKVKQIIKNIFLFTLLLEFGYSMSFSVTPNYHGVNLIYGYGKMYRSDLYKLRAKYAQVPKNRQTILVLNSQGGELRAGIAIGKFLKQNRIGAAVKKYGVCASSCAIALLGGRSLSGAKLQIVPLGSKLGFHQFYYNNRVYVNASQVQRDLNSLMNYTRYVNAPSSLVAKMMQTNANKLYWITNQDRRLYRFKSGYRNISFRNHSRYANRTPIIKNNHLVAPSSSTSRYLLTQTSYIRYYLSKVNTYLSANRGAYFNNNIALNDIYHKDWLSRNLNYVYIKKIKLSRANKVEAKVIYSLKNGKRVCSNNTYNLFQNNNGWIISNKTYKGCDHNSRKILRKYASLLP